MLCDFFTVIFDFNNECFISKFEYAEYHYANLCNAMCNHVKFFMLIFIIIESHNVIIMRPVR